MFSSLRRQLILICVSIVTLAMLAVVIANYVTVRTHTLNSLNSQVVQLAQSHASGITEWVRSKQAAVSSLGPAALAADPLPVIKSAEMSGDFDLAYIGYANKQAIFSQERKRAADYDPTARPWYLKAVEVGGPITTTPYIGASTGKLVVTFAEPIGPKGKVTAVTAADVMLTVVVNNVNSIKPTPKSYAFLIDGGGKIIAHPDQTLTMKSVQVLAPELTPALLEGLDGFGRGSPIVLNGRDVMLYVTKVEGTDWMLTTVLDKAEGADGLTSMLAVSGLLAILVVVLASLALMTLVRRVLVDWE